LIHPHFNAQQILIHNPKAKWVFNHGQRDVIFQVPARTGQPLFSPSLRTKYDGRVFKRLCIPESQRALLRVKSSETALTLPLWSERVELPVIRRKILAAEYSSEAETMAATSSSAKPSLTNMKSSSEVSDSGWDGIR
jgi:hypothetical protein